jgi:hypothetical protein
LLNMFTMSLACTSFPLIPMIHMFVFLMDSQFLNISFVFLYSFFSIVIWFFYYMHFVLNPWYSVFLIWSVRKGFNWSFYFTRELFISRASMLLFSWRGGFLYLYWILLSCPAFSSLFHLAVCVLLEFIQLFDVFSLNSFSCLFVFSLRHLSH